MDAAPIRILLIDDDEDDFILTRDILEEVEHFHFRLDWEMSYNHAYERVMQRAHDIYLIDYRLGENDGISLISRVVKEGISAPLILLTGKGDKRIDMQAMEEGAADYLVKGEITPQLIERTIRYALNNNRTLQLLKESENKFRQLFERSIDAIYISDKDHNLIDVNPSLSQLLGFSHEEIVGQNMVNLFADPEDFEYFKDQLEEDGHVKDFEVMFSTRQGHTITCQLNSIVRTDHATASIGYQGIIHDITLRKKAEQDLLIAERLSMTGKIARSIAHEVRNPLTNLGLAMDQLQDELPENEDAHMFVDIIKRNANRIEQLITEMLNSSKPKELHMELYSVNTLLDETIELTRDRITLKGIQVEKHYDQTVKPLFIDPDKLKIAILNVLVNAVEAVPENKGLLKIFTEWTDKRIKIKIADNGPGISAEDQARLFDPFYTKKQGGMGLGLTSTQNIIHSHQGAIEVVSKEAEGTSFTITLPHIMQHAASQGNGHDH